MRKIFKFENKIAMTIFGIIIGAMLQLNSVLNLLAPREDF